MHVRVLGGEVYISRKKDNSLVEITVSDKGGLDCSPPDSIKIEMTLEEARLVASALLEVQREAEREAEHALLVEPTKQEPKCQTAATS